MRMFALWEEATNCRMMPAFVCQKIRISMKLRKEVRKLVLYNALHPFNIFEYCAVWTNRQIGEEHYKNNCPFLEGLETAPKYLAEWLSARAQELN